MRSNDPAKRFVVATVSARSGPVLDGQVFQAVFLDEAAQTSEALVWGLLRPEVELLVLAGDTQQLPAMVSETGRPLLHDRSLMERLSLLNYDNTIHLTEQNRMAPELLAFPNAAFYDGRLTCGPHVPAHGTIEVHVVPEGREEQGNGTSWANRAEAVAAAALAKDDPDAVLISPYTAQCRLLLAQKTGRPVHTVDSFQGREADTIVLSIVRDGTEGLGFWMDPRRLNVALTRARKRLVLVVSGVEAWPEGAPLTRLVQSV